MDGVLLDNHLIYKKCLIVQNPSKNQQNISKNEQKIVKIEQNDLKMILYIPQMIKKHKSPH
jgi:hypothetical protein